MNVTGAFTADRLTAVGLAGLGAVIASSVQASGSASLGGSENMRDALLVGLAVVGGTMGGAKLRAFALGFGAAAAGTLIRRNVITV